MPEKDDLDPIPPKPAAGARRRRRWLSTLLLAGLVAALGASLLANLWLYALMRKYADMVGDARPDLHSENQFAADNARLGDPPPGVVRVVFAGDSDVEKWDPLPDVDGCQMVQRGFGGDRTGDLLVRLERDVIALKPGVAVVTIGGNDLEALAVFPPEQEEALVTICERNIRVIVDRLREKKIPVVLLTILPYGDVDVQDSVTLTDSTYRAVERVNAMIRTLNGPGVTVFDADPVLAQPNGHRKPAYSEEMVHLNRAGYEALNEALRPVLESAAKQAKP